MPPLCYPGTSDKFETRLPLCQCYMIASASCKSPTDLHIAMLPKPRLNQVNWSILLRLRIDGPSNHVISRLAILLRASLVLSVRISTLRHHSPKAKGCHSAEGSRQDEGRLSLEVIHGLRVSVVDLERVNSVAPFVSVTWDAIVRSRPMAISLAGPGSRVRADFSYPSARIE